MMKDRVQTQIERIIDEGDGENREVIVQLSYGRNALPIARELMRAAGQTIRDRSLAVAARSLLPASADAFESLAAARIPPVHKREFASRGQSLASQLCGIIRLAEAVSTDDSFVALQYAKQTTS